MERRRLVRGGLGVLAGLWMLALPVAAGAQEADTSPYGGGRTVVTVGPADTGGQTAAAETTTESNGTLPFTGGDVVTLAAVGVAAVAVGGVAVRTRRARHA